MLSDGNRPGRIVRLEGQGGEWLEVSGVPYDAAAGFSIQVGGDEVLGTFWFSGAGELLFYEGIDGALAMLGNTLNASQSSAHTTVNSLESKRAFDFGNAPSALSPGNSRSSSAEDVLRIRIDVQDCSGAEFSPTALESVFLRVSGIDDFSQDVPAHYDRGERAWYVEIPLTDHEVPFSVRDCAELLPEHIDGAITTLCGLAAIELVELKPLCLLLEQLTEDAVSEGLGLGGASPIRAALCLLWPQGPTGLIAALHSVTPLYAYAEPRAEAFAILRGCGDGAIPQRHSSAGFPRPLPKARHFEVEACRVSTSVLNASRIDGTYFGIKEEDKEALRNFVVEQEDDEEWDLPSADFVSDSVIRSIQGTLSGVRREIDIVPAMTQGTEMCRLEVEWTADEGLFTPSANTKQPALLRLQELQRPGIALTLNGEQRVTLMKGQSLRLWVKSRPIRFERAPRWEAPLTGSMVLFQAFLRPRPDVVLKGRTGVTQLVHDTSGHEPVRPHQEAMIAGENVLEKELPLRAGTSGSASSEGAELWLLLSFEDIESVLGFENSTPDGDRAACLDLIVDVHASLLVKEQGCLDSDIKPYDVAEPNAFIEWGIGLQSP